MPPMGSRSLRSHWPGLLGLLAVAAGLVWWAGPLGALAAGAIGVTWLALPSPYAVALAHVALIGLGSAPPPRPILIAVEIGLLGVLLAPLPSVGAGRYAASLGLAAAGLGGLVLATQQATDAPWLVGVALVIATALFGYGLHRLELVRLDLVEASP